MRVIVRAIVQRHDGQGAADAHVRPEQRRGVAVAHHVGAVRVAKLAGRLRRDGADAVPRLRLRQRRAARQNDATESDDAQGDAKPRAWWQEKRQGHEKGEGRRMLKAF